MRLARIATLLSVVSILFGGASQARGTPEACYGPSSDYGVACLDEKTGRLEWEYFPDCLGPCTLATDGRRLYMLTNEYNAEGLDHPVPRMQAIDLAARRPVAMRTLPKSARMGKAERYCDCAALRTSAGDRIVTETEDHRKVVILQGDSDKVRCVIPFPAGYDWVDVHGDVLIFCQMIPLGKTQWSRPRMIAVHIKTQKQLWTCSLDDLERPGFLGSGKRNLYAAGGGTVRAIDPRTGQTAWSMRLPGVGSESWAAEHAGRTYVAGQFGWTFNDTIYCLDAKTGAVLWRKGPWDSLAPWTLLFHNGKIYTQITMSGLAACWWHRDEPADALGYNGHKLGQVAILEDLFAGKSAAEIELRLRAWHALGDRAAIHVLKAAGEALTDPALKGLAGRLVETFPACRDYDRLVSFLGKEYDRDAAVQVEVGRVLREFRPPGWVGPKRPHEELLPNRPRPPRAAPTPEQQRVIEKYKALCDRVATLPPPGLKR